MKTTSKWLTSAASRRSSLITSLLEPPTTFPSMASKSVPSTSRPIQMAFDLQMKHSTQSRSRIYPTNGDKHLTTSSRSGASSGEARMTQNHDHPSMFLAGQFFPTASLVSPSGVDYNNRSSRTGVENSDGLTAAIPQQRGVLGFDVFELDAVRTAGGGKKEESQRVNPTKRQRRNSSTSRLQISRTNIDMDTWNNNGEISWEEDREGSRTVMSPTDNCFFPTPGLNWRNSPLSVPSGGSPLSSPGGHSTFNVVSSTQGFSSSSSPVRLLQHSLPAWFPWIPTKSQIESLKVNELREACIQRGLAKAGNKVKLQARLWQWTTERQQQHQARITGDYLTSWFEDTAIQNPNLVPKGLNGTKDTFSATKVGSTSTSSDNSASRKTGPRTIRNSLQPTTVSNTPNSLAEWSRSVDLDKLTQKRQEIHRQKRQGRKPPSSEKSNNAGPKKADNTSAKEYLARLNKAMKESPSSPYASNKEVKELYMASKQADQLGERHLAIQLLESLIEITPSDARVYRRLSRMYREQGNLNVARETIQKGLRRLPNNPWLWHGLGQLELSHGRPAMAVKHYRRAITEDLTFAHAYHAWGIYEHSQGHIARAMKILKKGIEYCPTNHRLHHALGDIYRGAKLLKDAERCYRRAVREGPPVSHGFAYSALACVAYEQGEIADARQWLYRAIGTNDGRHAQGWLALAQMEEAEGNTAKAISVCEEAIIRYERSLIESRQRYKRERDNDRSRRGSGNGESTNSRAGVQATSEMSVVNTQENMESVKNGFLKSVPPYRSGDKFINVFRHWGRLEGRYGSFDGTNRVYERASIAFPLNYNVPLDWAKYNAKLHNSSRARALFVEACKRASGYHADPYREYAIFEMKQGNYGKARKILFRGSQTVAQSSDGGLGNRRGLAQLFVTWAVCEWHLGNTPRCEVLFDHALRLTDAGDDGSELRAFILYGMARLEYYERNEVYLAQHCIGLCLKENSFPGGNSPVWKLWAEIAGETEDYSLEKQCLEQVAKCKSATSPSGDGRIRFDEADGPSIMQLLKATNMEQYMRQDPWTEKLQAVRGTVATDGGAKAEGSTFYSSIRFPRRYHSLPAEVNQESSEDVLLDNDVTATEQDEADVSERVANY